MSETRPTPYPPDTKAKGWRFELDIERVMQSDTWALASPEVRPWLLMLWTTAWQQVPCGSMPADDAIIAARLGMQSKAFTKAKPVLMRGWWQAEDGRLYNNTIVERVVDMLTRKTAERDRKAAYRAKMEGNRNSTPSAGVPQMSHGTDTGQTRDSGGKDATGTGTGTGTGLISKEVKDGYTSRESARANPAEVCLAMKSVGMASVNPSSPKLIALLDAGITKDEFVQAASDAVSMQKSFAYALAMAEGRRKDAQNAPDQTQSHAKRVGKGVGAMSFAERDRIAGMQRWEEMCGRKHPDLPDEFSKFKTGSDVINAEPETLRLIK